MRPTAIGTYYTQNDVDEIELLSVCFVYIVTKQQKGRPRKTFDFGLLLFFHRLETQSFVPSVGCATTLVFFRLS